MNVLAIYLYLTIRYINLTFNYFGNFYRIIDITKPNLASISDLAEYGSEIFFKAKPYSPKLYPRYQFIAYKIRLCRSEKKLRKKVAKIKERIGTNFFDLDKIYSDWDKKYAPGIIDLPQINNNDSVKITEVVET